MYILRIGKEAGVGGGEATRDWAMRQLTEGGGALTSTQLENFRKYVKKMSK